MGGQGGVLDERTSRRRCERASRSDPGGWFVGFDDVPASRDQQKVIAAGGQQQGLQPAKNPIRAPFLRQFHGGPGNASLMFLEHSVEPVDESHGVGGRAGESYDHLIVVKPAQLVGLMLHDRRSESHLTVGPDGNLSLVPHGQDRGHMYTCNLNGPDGPFWLFGAAGVGVVLLQFSLQRLAVNLENLRGLLLVPSHMAKNSQDMRFFHVVQAF